MNGLPSLGITRFLRAFIERFERNDEREFMPAALEVLETPPSPTGRLLAMLIGVFFTIAVAWAFLGKVDVVGSSYGGAVVFELARRHPEMVHALVLDEPAVVMFRPGTLDSLKALMGPGPALIDSSRAMFARGDSTRALEAFVNATLGPNAFNSLDAGTRRYFVYQMLELRKEMSVPASTWVPELRCEDGRPLTMPLLLITGGATLDMYRVLNQQIAGCLPAARLAVVPKVGHHKPDAPAFVTTVRNFFDSVTP